MSKTLLLTLMGLLAIILVAARSRADRVDDAALQLRVRSGDGAAVPPELAAAMEPWPSAGEAPSPEEVELGRLLFFDPVLSGNNEISCASCHHPDLGFSDGLQRSVGASGVMLARSAPSLWNVVFRPHLTWDGRAASLQSQMLDGPLFHPDEMAENRDTLTDELAQYPGYAARFEEVYGELTLERAAEAIAAFQRTLITKNSPFDRYAAGDFYALTGAQRRGFEIFRSNETNCIRCHTLPTFSSDDFKVVGVRDGELPFDPGRGGITGYPEDIGAFAVPTLRNVALTAPYMHNGIEQDLSWAIAFYLNGGGDNRNISRARLDPDLRPFDLSARELADLEAFLLSLTDESAAPALPEALPSGLTPPRSRENPARERVLAASALPPGEPRTHRVVLGDSIQEAIDRARPGDTVLVEPGRYFETLDIDVESMRLVGEGVSLVGRPFTPVGIVVRGNHVTLEGLAIDGFAEATIEVRNAQGTRLERVSLNGQTVTMTLE